MKKTLLIVLALWPVRGLFAQTTAEKADALMNGYTQVHKFNGTVLVAKNGDVILEKGCGMKNFKEQSLNDVHTIYQVASITKQFTAAVILKLVELHKLALTDKLDKYYPQYPNGGQISINNLLTHTAGIPDYTQDSVFMRTVVRRPEKSLSVAEALTLYNKTDFAPGTSWKYSNQGYWLLGDIIAKVTKTTWYAAVRKYIFSPLAMDHSGFDFKNLNNKDKATGYYTYPEAGHSQEATIIDSAESYSAGAIYSTVGDMYKWHRALQSYKIVNKALMAQAYTPFKNHYGFGWQIDSLFGKRVISHSGDIWGFKTNIARITDDNVCIVLLNNIEDEEVRGGITHDLLAILYNQPYTIPVKRQEVPVDKATLSKYAGTYVTPRFALEVTISENQLWVQPAGQPKTRFYAQKEDYFFSKEIEAQLEFITDPNGKVDHLIVYMGGQQMTGKKTK